MQTFFDISKSVLKFIANFDAVIVLAVMFLGAFVFYIVCLVIGQFLKNKRFKIKGIYLTVSKLSTLLLSIYCLAECFFIGKVFNLISTLLTVSIFYALAIVKFYLFPSTFKGARKKLFEKLKNGIEDSQTSLTPQEELLNIFKKIATENINLDVNAPNFDGINEIVQKFDDIEISQKDRANLDLLDSLSTRLKAIKEISKEDLEDLNDKLLALLKMLSKYEVAL